MKITIITLFPQMIQSFFDESIIKKALDKKAVEIELVNLREFALDHYGSVDERPYGGGAGMVLRVEPVVESLKSINHPQGRSKILLTSAKGKRYDQKKAQELSQLDHVVILAGHYEGFDERILDFVDEEVSLGDFVMTGGEIAAAAITDSIVRLIPGVLKKDDATQQESFFEVPIDEVIRAVGEDELLADLKSSGFLQITLLEYPHYTRPADYEGKKVPEVLMNGNHEEINIWRIRQAYNETRSKRPDLLDKVRNR